MHIGIASPITISDFFDCLDFESQLIAKNINGLKAPSVDTLIRGLINEGHKVSIYTLTPEVNQILKLQGSKLKIFVAPYRRKGWKRAIDLFSYESKNIEKLIYMDSNLPDILHANWTYEYSRGVANFTNKIPILVTVHDWAPKVLRLNLNYYRLSRYVLDYLIFKTKGLNFIANSPYIASKVNNRWGLNISFIPNAINDIYLSKKKHYLKRDIYKIICVSNNVSKGKNIEKLLYSFQQFRVIIPNSTLNLVGIPFLKTNPTIQKWNKLNILEGVNLLGSLNHIALIEEYDKADVLVHPSLEESFGNVLIEAMARKLAIIGGKNSGAVPYVLNNGEAGLLCDVTSVKDLFDAILNIYSNEKLRKKLINNGDLLVNSVYLQKTVIDQTIKIYNDLILKFK
jgi:glycosyltransferase involved in cell wall biosynthesis